MGYFLASSSLGLLSDPVVLLAIVIGFYMAWNVGANDVANAMGTSVGSKSLTLRQAVVIAGIFEFAGAVLVGSSVTDTVRKGIINPEDFAATPELLMYGMLAALVAAAAWLHVASFFGQPVSTTHSIVGAVFGFGLISGNAVQWETMGEIVASWFISPIASGLLAMLVFWLILKFILRARDPDLAAQKYAPYVAFLVVFILALSFIYKGLKNIAFFSEMDLVHAIAWSSLAGAVAAIATWFIVARIVRKVALAEEEKLEFVERIFGFLQIVTAAYVAFAHGANDVANAVGPLAAVYHIQTTGEVSMKVSVPIWILALGGLGIVVGLLMMGWRVIETVGSKITEITPSRGFASQFAGASSVLICSKLGLPVSTTHCLVGGVLGVALVRGITALDAKTTWAIIGAWVVTVPITGILTVILYWGMRVAFVG